MNIIQLIRGDVAAAQETLRSKAKEVTRLIQSGKSTGCIHFEQSEKQVFFPIFDGLGVPYRDLGVHGTIVGVSQDLVDKEYYKI